MHRVVPAQEIARHHDVLFHHEHVAARGGRGAQIGAEYVGALLATPIRTTRRHIHVVAAELWSELVDDIVDARVMAAIGTKKHVQIADALGPSQIIEAVPEKLGPAPARNDQYIAVLDQRICHGASVLRPATHQDAAHRRCRPGWQLVDLIRHRAWCWSRHELDWSFGT